MINILKTLLHHWDSRTSGVSSDHVGKDIHGEIDVKKPNTWSGIDYILVHEDISLFIKTNLRFCW